MKICSIPNCGNVHAGKGLCRKHYDALPENKEKARIREKEPHRLLQREKARNDPKWKNYRKNWRLIKDYGITLEDFNVLYEKQNGCCAICDNVLSKPHLDHDHKSGKVRGLLCKPCNQGLGFLQDSVEVLNKAIQYLVHSNEN